MRRDTSRQNSTCIARAAAAPEHRTKLAWLGSFGLLLILLMTSRMAMADPARRDPSVAVSTAALLAVHVDPPKPRLVRETSMNDLLVVPHETHYQSDAELADMWIAAAVARGTNPDLVRASAFRKRSNDLFRTEREVEIGERKMLVRLRLRTAMRRAMSVEVRF